MFLKKERKENEINRKKIIYKKKKKYVYTKRNKQQAKSSYKKVFKVFKSKKVRRRKFIKKRIFFFLFINLTVNNLFAYVYNFYLTSGRKRIKMNRFKFFSISSGLSKYSGKARLSNIALETAGRMFARKLYFNNVQKVNLVLNCRLNRKIKEFLKGLRGIEIKRIFFFPKLAHNGCRLRARKRL